MQLPISAVVPTMVLTVADPVADFGKQSIVERRGRNLKAGGCQKVSWAVSALMFLDPIRTSFMRSWKWEPARALVAMNPGHRRLPVRVLHLPRLHPRHPSQVPELHRRPHHPIPSDRACGDQMTKVERGALSAMKTIARCITARFAS